MSLSFLLHDNQDSSVWMVLIASSFQCMSTVSNDMGSYLYSVYMYIMNMLYKIRYSALLITCIIKDCIIQCIVSMRQDQETDRRKCYIPVGGM